MENLAKKDLLSQKLDFVKSEIQSVSNKRFRLFEEQKEIDLRLTELIQQAKNLIDEKQELSEIIDFETFKNTGN